MLVNKRGHVVNSDGSQTEPMKSQFWMGDENYRIAFDALVLDDKSVAIHALYGSVTDGVIEDFMYEVVSEDEAADDFRTMILEARAFLVSEGVKVVANFKNLTLQEVFEKRML